MVSYCVRRLYCLRVHAAIVRDRENNTYAKSNNSAEFIADPKRKKKIEKKERKEAEKRAAEAEHFRKMASEGPKQDPVFYIPATSDAAMTVSPLPPRLEWCD